MTDTTAHSSSRRYPPEIKGRAVRMVVETIERTGEPRFRAFSVPSCRQRERQGCWWPPTWSPACPPRQARRVARAGTGLGPAAHRCSELEVARPDERADRRCPAASSTPSWRRRSLARRRATSAQPSPGPGPAPDLGHPQARTRQRTRASPSRTSTLTDLSKGASPMISTRTSALAAGVLYLITSQPRSLRSSCSIRCCRTRTTSSAPAPTPR